MSPRRWAGLVVGLLWWAPTGAAADPSATNDGDLTAWSGQRVHLLGTEPPACVSPPELGPFTYAVDGRKSIEVNRFAGGTGAVVGARILNSYQAEIVSQLDSGERVTASSAMGIAFDAELEIARGLVGRSWWSKGAQEIGNPATQCEEHGGRRVPLRNLERVTITGAEFGTHLQKIHLLVKTDDGRQGVLDGWEGNDYVDPRFHILEEGRSRRGVRLGPYSDRFHLTNPRETYKSWSPAVWKLVEAGEVAVGMTEEMARVACGREPRTIGFELVLGGTDDTAAVLECGEKRFKVEEGKVTKFVDR